MLSLWVLAVSFRIVLNAPDCDRRASRPIRSDIFLKKSTSRGKHNEGKLVNAVILPIQQPSLAVLPGEFRTRNRNYTSTALANTLVIAASKLRETYNDATVYIGDLSKPKGGFASHHRSHQNGLDVDIAFFYRDRQGRLVTPKDFWVIGSDGIKATTAPYTLDAMLCWQLISALLRTPHGEVQWIFVSTPVKEQILAAGRAAKAPEEILRRAEIVLQQPSRGFPHDDHFHLRLYCPPADRLEDCEDTGPVWDWLSQPPEIKQPDDQISLVRD